MQTDPKATTKIQQIIKAVCKEWEVSEVEVKTKNTKSTVKITDARRAICYMVKHNNNIQVPRFVLASVLGVEGYMVSKYVRAMGRFVRTYDDIAEKIEQAARNTPFLVKQLKIEFKQAA